MANAKKQDQQEFVQRTIDEIIAEIAEAEANEAEAKANETQTQKQDICEGCSNHTCDWGACCMSKN